jgi:hypothetical protein
MLCRAAKFVLFYTNRRILILVVQSKFVSRDTTFMFSVNRPLTKETRAKHECCVVRPNVSCTTAIEGLLFVLYDTNCVARHKIQAAVFSFASCSHFCVFLSFLSLYGPRSGVGLWGGLWLFPLIDFIAF